MWNCVVPENTQTDSTEGYWKFQGVGRFQKPKFWKKSTNLNWNF